MNDDDPFESAKLLVESARGHVEDIKNVLDAFFGRPDVCARFEEIDPQTGERLIKARLTEKLPPRVRMRVSSAVNDLRHALDQACYASAQVFGTGRDRTYFPFARNPADLEVVFTTRSKHVPEAIRPYLRSLHPYPSGDGYAGGDNQLRALSDISGPNKHRIILDPIILSDSIALDQILMTPGTSVKPAWDRRKHELTILRMAPGAYADIKCDVNLLVAFREGPGVEGANVLDVLLTLIPKVAAIVEGIERETLRLASPES